jgi:hypothetical protein
MVSWKGEIMGVYINPKVGTKEEWLKSNALVLGVRPCKFDEVPSDNLQVCLIHNGAFTAAGICYNTRELDAFQNPKDSRPKIFFLAKTSDLLEVCPELKLFLEHSSYV